MTAIGIVTTSMAKGTIAKIAQIKSTIKSGGLRDLFILQDAFDGTNRGVPRDEFQDQVQWNAILDLNVCAYCASLNGAYFYYNDPQKPIPGDDFDIHPNCRCFWDYLPSVVNTPLAAEAANLIRRTTTSLSNLDSL